MLFWDIRWKEFEDDICNLNLNQRLNITLASLESVLINNEEHFKLSINEEQKKNIGLALDILWGKGTKEKGVVVDKLDEYTCLDNESGVNDVLMAILFLLNAEFELTADDTLEVLSYIYQAVLDMEIISLLESETLESEVQTMEENNRKCLEVIDEQLGFLKKIKNGYVVHRRT